MLTPTLECQNNPNVYVNEVRFGLNNSGVNPMNISYSNCYFMFGRDLMASGHLRCLFPGGIPCVAIDQFYINFLYLGTRQKIIISNYFGIV